MSATKNHIIMENQTDQPVEQPKKKGNFWKTLLKIVTVGFVVTKVLAEDNVIRGTGGDVLKKVNPNILDGIGE
jgi:hypothetical protein